MSDQPIYDNDDSTEDLRPTENPYDGSLLPDDMLSIDPTQVIDFTGTIGTVPVSMAAQSLEGPSMDPEDDEAVTRMLDDDFYKQIQTFFPAAKGTDSAIDSGSQAPAESAMEDEISGGDAHPDGAPSMSVRSSRSEFSHSDFIPPVRDIRFPTDTTSLEKARATDPESMLTDEYGVVAKLGEGGYGVVYEADQLALNRPVAVKVLKPKRKSSGSKSPRTGTGSGELQRRRDQFLHEAKITARLQHPNIVPLYDFGVNKEGQLFYSMKKVERRPWSSVIHNPAKLLGISETKLNGTAERESIKKNVEIFERVCDAMAYSHAQKIIHRDLKPDNIMIGDYGEVLLIDFGMALDLNEPDQEFSAGGTLVYMAPEMAKHFAKQKEIQVAARRTAKKLGMEQGSVFLDKTNLMGIGKLAQELIQQSKDQGVIELAETLIRLDSEEKQLATQINDLSDIYLLGAILYQVAVGHPPHYYPIAHCKKGKKEKFQRELWLALRNGCQQYAKITDPLRQSLRDIAIKAMKTDPADRFQTVEELKTAIKNFQLQVQSLELIETGKESLQKAAGGSGYQFLLPALESFRGASELWPEGEEAPQMQLRAACEFGERAHRQRDYDAGLSILDEYVASDQTNESSVVEVRRKLNSGKRTRQRNRLVATIGWIAAVALPIGVWAWFAPTLFNLRDQIADQELVMEQNKEDIELAQTELKDAQKLAKTAVEDAQKDAKKEIDKIKFDTGKEIADQKKAAADAKIKADKDIADAKKKAEKDIADAKKKAEKDIADANAAAQKEVQRTQKLAADQIKKSKQIAAEFQFDANFGEYNANVLTVPLDLRTGKLDEAQKKLKSLKTSDAKPTFVNGWAVAHFSKRASGNDTKFRMPDNVPVERVMTDGNGDSWILAGGARRTLFKVSGDQLAPSPIKLPGYGMIADAAISSDGKLLAVALDNLDDNANQLAVHVADTSTGIALTMSDAEEDAEVRNGIMGCRSVALGPDNSILSVEELSGNRGLKNRLQVVRRRIEGQSMVASSPQLVPATTRDEGRPIYRCVAQWFGDQPAVGLAYQSLDDGGKDIFKLQTLTGSEFESSSVEITKFPTSLHFGKLDAFYCGHADGFVDCFEATSLTTRPLKSENENESSIIRLASTPSGNLVSGSVNGTVVLWKNGLQFVKRLNHLPGDLTEVAFAGQTDELGTRMITGDAEGNVSVWYPETGKHDAIVRHDSPVRITCAAVDESSDAGDVPATAYGTHSGQVYYFDKAAMQGLSDPKFRFKSPFEKFGTAFNDFDSMGIVGDYFVLLKDDGVFYSNYIDRKSPKSSARTGKIDLSEGKSIFGNFSPLMASVTDQNYFFSTNPQDGTQLLGWRKEANQFLYQPIDLPTSNQGQIKRMAMSDDGNWLAIVRAIGRLRLSGIYVVEVYDIESLKQRTSYDQVRLAGTTGRFQVGDPSFVDFAPNNRELILHFHKRGVDRETWVERWELGGSRWTQKGDSEKIENRKVALVDWDLNGNAERLITKISRSFFLHGREQNYERNAFQFVSTGPRDRLRSVRATGNGDNSYFVLSTNDLSLYDGTEPNKTASLNREIRNARDLRVFGKQAVLLDDTGFHLVDSKLTHVTLLAEREVEVEQVALSGQRLAILYSNGRCRIWDVSGQQPQPVGEVENATAVTLSRDSKWAAIHNENQVGIFGIETSFDQPKMQIALQRGAIEWSGKAPARLIVARSADGKTAWESLDPTNGNVQMVGNLPTEIEVDQFAIAPTTGKYVAISTKGQMSLWVTGDQPMALGKEHDFDASQVKDVSTFSFSEIWQDDLENVGTRLSVLSKQDATLDGTNAEPLLFLMASDTVELPDEVTGEETATQKYKVVEIKGALEKRPGIELLDMKFSGDGKTLLQADEKGTSTLLGTQ